MKERRLILTYLVSSSSHPFPPPPPPRYDILDSRSRLFSDIVLQVLIRSMVPTNCVFNNILEEKLRNLEKVEGRVEVVRTMVEGVENEEGVSEAREGGGEVGGFEVVGTLVAGVET